MFSGIFNNEYMSSYTLVVLPNLGSFQYTTLACLTRILVSRRDRRTLPPEPRHRCKTLPPLVYSFSS